MGALDGFAPELSALMQGLGPAQNASVKGLPAVNSFLKDATPFFGALSPALAQLNPLVQYLGAYPSELTSFFANVTAATNAARRTRAARMTNYVRVMGPLSPEGLAGVPAAHQVATATRRTTSRAACSPGCPARTCRSTTRRAARTGPAPQLNPNTASVLGASADGPHPASTAFGNDPANVPAPSLPAAGQDERRQRLHAVPAGRAGRAAAGADLRRAVGPPPVARRGRARRYGSARC